MRGTAVVKRIAYELLDTFRPIPCACVFLCIFQGNDTTEKIQQQQDTDAEAMRETAVVKKWLIELLDTYRPLPCAGVFVCAFSREIAQAKNSKTRMLKRRAGRPSSKQIAYELLDTFRPIPSDCMLFYAFSKEIPAPQKSNNSKTRRLKRCVGLRGTAVVKK